MYTKYKYYLYIYIMYKFNLYLLYYLKFIFTIVKINRITIDNKYN